MDTNRLSPWIWAVVAVILIGTFYSAFDGKFYWHDVRFLYAAAEFTLPQVFAGAFNPHQAWNQSNELSASGFYVAKMLHIWLVHTVLDFRSQTEGGIDLVIALYSMMMLLAVIFSAFLFNRIFADRYKAIIAVIALALMPIIPYLTGKLLSETASLFFLVISILILSISFNTRQLTSLVLAFIAGVFLGLAMLCRLDSVVGAVGFVFASVFVSLFTEDRTHVIRQALVMFVVAVSVVFYVYHLAGVDFEAIALYFQAFTSAGQKSLAMTPLGIISFGGVVFLPALVAVLFERSRVYWFFIIWFAMTFLPLVILTTLYMVEPRYLIQSAVPLAGLSALGITRVLASDAGTKAMFQLAAFAMVTILLNQLLIKTMPYELDRHAMHQVIDKVITDDPDAVLTIPWSYTDFNYLNLVLPADRIYNVNSPVGMVSKKDINAFWMRRYSNWYQGRYLENLHDLDKVLSKNTVYYLAWRGYPPIQMIRDQAESLGLSGIVKVLDGLGMLDHRTQSWMWNHKSLIFELRGKVGQYEYYRVTR